MSITQEDHIPELDQYTTEQLLNNALMRCKAYSVACELPTNDEDECIVMEWKGDEYFNSLGLLHGLLQKMNATVLKARLEDEQD